MPTQNRPRKAGTTPAETNTSMLRVDTAQVVGKTNAAGELAPDRGKTPRPARASRQAEKAGTPGAVSPAGASAALSAASSMTNVGRRNGDRGARRSGRRAHVRLSGRRGAADLRRAVPAGQGAPHPGAARAGRRPCRRGLCALDRQGRLRAGHLGARRDQCGHRPDRRAVRFDPAGRASPGRCRRT